MDWIRGYTDQLSYLPNEEVVVYFTLGTKPGYQIGLSLHVIRIGAEDEEVLRLTIGPAETTKYPHDDDLAPPNMELYSKGFCYEPSAPRVPWRDQVQSHVIPPAGNWSLRGVRSSGYYEIRAKVLSSNDPSIVVDENTPPEPTGMFFVVRPRPDDKDKSPILVVLPTNTQNAYNGAGGASFYIKFQESDTLSFNRPVFPGMDWFEGPIPWDSSWEWHHTRSQGSFDSWVLKFIKWAEAEFPDSGDTSTAPKKAYKIDYAVNSDLQFAPQVLDRVRLVVSIGHDEYWSEEMRNCMESFVEDGGHVAFLGGNNCYRRVELDFSGTTRVMRRSSDPDWAGPLNNRPESTLTGVLYDMAQHPKDGDVSGQNHRFYMLTEPDPQNHFLLQKIGLSQYDEFGEDTVEYNQHIADGLLNFEIDGIDYTLEDEQGSASDISSVAALWALTPADWKARKLRVVPTYKYGTPTSFSVLACFYRVKEPDTPHRFPFSGPGGIAVLGYYRHPRSGAVVVSTGSCGWANGLAKPLTSASVAATPYQPVKAIQQITINILDLANEGRR